MNFASKSKKLIKIVFFSSVFFFFLIGCSQPTTHTDGGSPHIEMDFGTADGIIQYVNTNISRLNIVYDREKDSCYTDIPGGGVKVIYDIVHAKSNGDRIFLPYSFILEGQKYFSSAFYPINKENSAGILLSFDDYYWGNWDIYLSLFENRGVKATFFCVGWSMAEKQVVDFYKKANQKGMEAGFHSRSHIPLYGYPTPSLDISEELFVKEYITPLDHFRTLGADFSNCLAFPGGKIPNNKDYIARLKKTYKILRAAGKNQITWIYSPEEIKSLDYIYGYSLDKIYFPTFEKFKTAVDRHLIITKITGGIYSCYSHYIQADGDTTKQHDGYAWTIHRDNLLYLFDRLDELNLKSYLYKDFY